MHDEPESRPHMRRMGVVDGGKQDVMPPASIRDLAAPPAVQAVVAELDKAGAGVLATIDAAAAEVADLRKLFDHDLARIRVDIKALGVLGLETEQAANTLRDRVRDMRSQRTRIVKALA